MEELDNSFFLAALQLFEEQEAIEGTQALKRVMRSRVRSGASRFASPVTTAEWQRKVVNAVPQKTKQQTKCVDELALTSSENREVCRRFPFPTR